MILHWALALLTVLVPINGLVAMEDNWREQPYPYIAFQQELPEVLQEFGRNMSMQIRVSEALEGKVSGNFTTYKAGEFLDFLARSHGVIWFDDGFSLDFLSGEELESRMLPLGKVTPDRLRSELEGLGLTDDRFPLRAGAGSGTVMVAGPGRYIELIENTIDSLNRAGQRKIDVFRGVTKSDTSASPNGGGVPDS